MFTIQRKPSWLPSILASLMLAVSSQAAEPIAETQSTNIIRVACVGDSITLGTGLTDPTRESYPAQLAALLGEKWEVKTFAANGVTALSNGSKPFYLEEFVPAALWSEADVFIIMYGTNDSNLPSWEHAAEFVRDYGDLLSSFANLPNKPRIWVCHPPPVYPDNSDWVTRIQKELIPKIDEVAAAKKVPVIDFFQPMQAHPELFTDGVHPTADGARLMAEIVYRELTGKTPAAEMTLLRIRVHLPAMLRIAMQAG